MEEPELTYFGIQAYLGSTKHGGGQDSTDELIKLCGIRKGSRVLDVGCSMGITARMLAKMGCTVVGIDNSARMIERAKETESSVEFLVADAQKLPFDDNSFDAVICESVIVFVDDRKKALKECARVTKPGGSIGINEIFWEKEPPEKMEDAVMEVYELKDRIPTYEAWVNMLEAAGLKDITGKKYGLISLRELSRMKRYGLKGIGIMYRTIAAYITNPGFRGYMNKLAKLPKNFPDYMAYALFVGKKA